MSDTLEDPAPGSPRLNLPIEVVAADIDDLGHVNNVVYLRWVQEAAEAHWRAAATERELGRIAWVVLRHEIDYHVPAQEGDAVTACTWVLSWSGARSQRRCDLIRERDGVVLARSLTSYCSVDAESHRPCRVDPTVRGRFLPTAQ